MNVEKLDSLMRRAQAAEASAAWAATGDDIWLAGFFAGRAVEAAETVKQLRLKNRAAKVEKRIVGRETTLRIVS